MSTNEPTNKSVNRLVIYRPKAGKLADLEAIVTKHGSVLRATGLLAEDPVRVYRGTDLRKPEQGTFLVEHFIWRDEKSSDLAHQTPEVMAVWETMGPLMDSMTLTTLEVV